MTVALPSLPVELWLEVFRWATSTRGDSALYTTVYRPFEPNSIDVIASDAYAETRQTKCALVLVCKRWRRWAIPLLYEDITIPTKFIGLERMLRYGAVPEGDTTISVSPCACLVRRIGLPYSTTVVTSPQPIEPLKVLTLCSSTEVLARIPDFLLSSAYEFDTECPPLPSLKRLDWWHHNEAARTGGINSLPHVLGNAPKLEYLSILDGDLWPSYLYAPPVHLSHLTTLRLRRVNAILVLQMCHWSLPSLRHVVFDRIDSPELFEPFWDAFGQHIRTVELGLSLRFLMHDFLSPVFRGCTHLEELNYYVFLTHVPRPNRPQESLRTIGLHASTNSAFFHVGSADFWSHLRYHLGTFTEATYPALRRVNLYGDWSAVVGDQQFDELVKPLRDRGCTVDVL
ncbi:hypothetical protein ONZ51_g4926 [Trametes cubensis]|uniref:F-box domain-containing protein n=1 Tax=Trametes cubensis TaxID=1111947 RepID=A0AAD7TV37_9APHY|nr:hypothetical protein ONZ51_g4926 [Trametes cubensis]